MIAEKGFLVLRWVADVRCGGVEGLLRYFIRDILVFRKLENRICCRGIGYRGFNKKRNIWVRLCFDGRKFMIVFVKGLGDRISEYKYKSGFI